MRKITLHDGRVANFPDTAHPKVIGSAIARLLSKDGGKGDMDAEEKSKKQEQDKRDKIDETRHSEKVAVGMQGVKASQDRNKATADHVKATKEIAPAVTKSLDANAAKIAAELAAIRKSLDSLNGLGKQLKELTGCIDELGSKLEQGIKLVVATMGKPKKIVRSERGALTGIRNEDE